MSEPLAEPETFEQALRPVAARPLCGAGIDGGHFHVFERAEIGQQLIALEDEAEMLAAQRGQIVGAEAAHIAAGKGIGAPLA